MLPQLRDILPDLYIWGEVSVSPLSLRIRILIPPADTVGSLLDYSALTSDLNLFYWSSPYVNFVAAMWNLTLREVQVCSQK